MKQFILKNKTTVFITAICVTLATIAMSFQTIQFGPLQQFDTLTDVPDTIPTNTKEEQLNIKQFNELMEHLNIDMKKAMEEVKKVDVAKLNEEIKSSLKDIDAEKIKKQIDEAMKQVDIASIQNEMSKALKEVEWNKINTEVKMALDKAKEEISQIDMKEINEQLAGAKIQIEKAKAELKKIDLNKALKEAEKNVKEAEKNLQLQKEMFDEMEKDGLIDTKAGFSVEYKNKELFINGKRQPDAVTGKYRKYIKEDNYKITIKKDE